VPAPASDIIVFVAGRCRVGCSAALVTGVLAACGGGGAPADAGGDGGLATPPAPPGIPWLDDGGPPIAPPALAPCPAGWREVRSEAGVVTCDPYPEGGPVTCNDGEAHFPGEPACAPVGSPCPAGDFADGLPAAGKVHYVLAGASGGDGSRAAPFGRIAEALATAGPGTIIAIGKGRYDEVVALRPGVTVRGACAAETRLVATGADPRPAVVVASVAGGVVRDLTIADSPRSGVLVHGSGAELRLEGVVVAGTETIGVEARDRARLVVESVVVRDTRSRPDGERGRGLQVWEGASAEVSRALFERNREAAVRAADDGTSLRLADVVARDTGSGIDGQFGMGLAVQTGASAEVSRSLFERNREAAVSAADEGTSLRLGDVIARDTESRRDGRLGLGLRVTEGAGAEVSRALFERNREVAVGTADEGTSLTLADAVVRDTGSLPDGQRGRGLEVGTGASAEVSRVLFERNREVAVFVLGAGARLTLADAVVRDTESHPDGQFGLGLQLREGASVEVSRALFERNREVAVLALGAVTSLTLVDAVVRDTESRPDELSGRGLEVNGRASAQVSRALFERNREAGVLATGEGTSVTFADTVVRDTESRPDGILGHNVASVASAELAMTRFVVTRASLCGLLLSFEGQMDLSSGEVSESRFGICLQVPGYARSRLLRDVVFRDVGGLHPIEETSFPAPEPSEPTGVMR
jgi:hypothetical protein